MDKAFELYLNAFFLSGNWKTSCLNFFHKIKNSGIIKEPFVKFLGPMFLENEHFVSVNYFRGL